MFKSNPNKRGKRTRRFSRKDISIISEKQYYKLVAKERNEKESKTVDFYHWSSYFGNNRWNILKKRVKKNCNIIATRIINGSNKKLMINNFFVFSGTNKKFTKKCNDILFKSGKNKKK